MLVYALCRDVRNKIAPSGECTLPERYIMHTSVDVPCKGHGESKGGVWAGDNFPIGRNGAINLSTEARPDLCPTVEHVEGGCRE